MSKKRVNTVFCPEFLKRAFTREPIPLSTCEATWAGPWVVAFVEGEFTVHRVGDPTPVAITRFYETALLLAAILPAVGRGPLYWLSDQEAAGRMFGLMTILGEQGFAMVGRFERRHEELLGPLSIVEHLLRCPASLAYVIEAAPAETLEQVEHLIADRRQRREHPKTTND